MGILERLKEEILKTQKKVAETRKKHQNELNPLERRSERLFGRYKEEFESDGSIEGSLKKMYFKRWDDEIVPEGGGYILPHNFSLFVKEGVDMSKTLEENRGKCIIRGSVMTDTCGFSIGMRYTLGRIAEEGPVLLFDFKNNEILFNVGKKTVWFDDVYKEIFTDERNMRYELELYNRVNGNYLITAPGEIPREIRKEHIADMEKAMDLLG